MDTAGQRHGQSHVSPQVAETEFTCKLITIRTKKSFTKVTGALESRRDGPHMK